MHKYKLLGKKGEGSYSEVLKAQVIKNGKLVAIKKMKTAFNSIEEVNNLREIQALRRLSPHPNIIKLIEVLYDRQTGRLALVFELMEANVYEIIRNNKERMAETAVKRLMYQLIRSMDHMHRNGIFHRDIKPENILVVGDRLKLADFGSCRGIYSKQPYSEYISTRWYRAPECLLTDGYYNYKMDMWGVGCVFAEVLTRRPLFPGQNEVDQINKIHEILGTPSAELVQKIRKGSRAQHMSFNFPRRDGTGVDNFLPGVTKECVDIIKRLLAYNPEERLSARQALRHPYFRDMVAADAAASEVSRGLPSVDQPPRARGNNDAGAASHNLPSITKSNSLSGGKGGLASNTTTHAPSSNNTNTAAVGSSANKGVNGNGGSSSNAGGTTTTAGGGAGASGAGVVVGSGSNHHTNATSSVGGGGHPVARATGGSYAVAGYSTQPSNAVSSMMNPATTTSTHTSAHASVGGGVSAPRAGVPVSTNPYDKYRPDYLRSQVGGGGGGGGGSGYPSGGYGRGGAALAPVGGSKKTSKTGYSSNSTYPISVPTELSPVKPKKGNTVAGFSGLTVSRYAPPGGSGKGRGGSSAASDLPPLQKATGAKKYGYGGAARNTIELNSFARGSGGYRTNDYYKPKIKPKVSGSSSISRTDYGAPRRAAKSSYVSPYSQKYIQQRN